MTLDDVLDTYRTHLLAAGRGPGTIRLRMTYLAHLRDEHPALLDVTFEQLEAYLAARRSTHMAETRKSMRASFRLFYAWAHERGHVRMDPALRLESVRIPGSVPRLAPDGAVLAALPGANPGETAIILLARLGCLRRAEIASLHMRDRVHDVLRVTGKGEKQRIVYCNPQLLAALLELEQHGEHGFYFPGRIDGHVHPDTVYETISSRTGWNPHSLRHAGATAAFRSTHDLRAVQQMLGHASIATTERYLHVAEDELRAAAAGTAFRSAS